MSFQIQYAITHGIKKATNTSVATVKHKPQCFHNDDPILIAFTEELLMTYTTEVNTWGAIEEPEQNIFHQKLINWQSPRNETERLDFLDFTKSTVDEIKSKIVDSYKATGGYVLLINYLKDNNNFLLIVMLKLETTYGIDEEDMSFYETQSFTMKHFHEAVRLNLTTWLTRNQPEHLDEEGLPERCLSFVKRRGEEQDITRYFRNALGCKNFAESTANTVNLIQAVNDFMVHKNMEPAVQLTKTAELHGYLANKLEEKQPVSLRAVTALLSPTSEETEENELLKFIKDGDYKIDETFKPNARKVRELDRVSGKIGKTSINFPVEELGKSVLYNSTSREITLRYIPDELDQKIKKANAN